MSLSENTSKMQQLLAAISALPDAGSGSADPVLQAKSVTPSETTQTVTPDSGYDGLSSVSVGAISKTYVGSSVTRKSAQTYTPGTSNQTISSGQYLNGVQTILGDADLVAGNIKKGVTIFDVLGTFEGSGGGLPSGVSKFVIDEYIPTEDVSTNQSIVHGLGVTPNFFVWWLVENMSTTPVAGINIGGAIIGKNAKYSATSSTLYTTHSFYRGYNNTPQVNGAVSSNAGTTYMNATNCRMLCSSTYKLKAGYTYRWIAGVVDGIN